MKIEKDKDSQNYLDLKKKLMSESKKAISRREFLIQSASLASLLIAEPLFFGCAKKQDKNQNAEVKDHALHNANGEMEPLETFANAAKTFSDKILELTGHKIPQGIVGVPYFSQDPSDRKESSMHGLLKDARDAFVQMRNAAYKDNIKLVLLSSYRSYEHQKQEWNENMHNNDLESIRSNHFVIPGTSPHHWGTDIDICSYPYQGFSTDEKNYARGGPFEEMFLWMQKNAEKYGFCILAPDNWDTRGGMSFEPWHYSYIDLHKIKLKEYFENLEDILDAIKPSTGIIGQEYMTKEFLRSYIKEYLLCVNPKVLPS